MIIYLPWLRKKCRRADEQKNEWAGMCEGYAKLPPEGPAITHAVSYIPYL